MNAVYINSLYVTVTEILRLPILVFQPLHCKDFNM